MYKNSFNRTPINPTGAGLSHFRVIRQSQRTHLEGREILGRHRGQIKCLHKVCSLFLIQRNVIVGYFGAIPCF